MVVVEHLSFSFGEKLGFINYCKNALNLQATRVPRTTLSHTHYISFIKKKQELHDFLSLLMGAYLYVAMYEVITGNTILIWGSLVIGLIVNGIYKKRVIAFRVFDERHTAHNIYKMIKIVLEEYDLINKIFSIGFDNASANTASILELEKVCNPVFGSNFFHQTYVCHILNLCVQGGLK